MLELLAQHIRNGDHLQNGITVERLLQGPFADAMTHAGQLAYVATNGGSSGSAQNFVDAKVNPEHLGPNQAEPASPDEQWPEAPPEWSAR